MAYLENIIEHIETSFGIQVHGRFHAKTEIDGIQFLISGTEADAPYSSRLLYVGHASVLPSAHLPQNLLLTDCCTPIADSSFLSIQEPLELPLIFNAVQEIIFKYNAFKLKREELFHSLHQNKGITGMIQVAHSALDNPITICDTSFSVIAACPVVKDLKNLVEKHGRLYLRDSLFQNMADKNIIKHIYSSSTPYITTLDAYPYKWVFRSIQIQHAVVGYICVRGTIRKFTEDDMEFIDVLSQMLSIEMQKDSAYSYPTGLKYEYFLTELLEGHFDRSDYICSHLIPAAHTQKSFYTILLLKFMDASAKPRQFKGYFQQLLSILPNCMVVIFRGDLTILLPSDSSSPFSEKVLNRFTAFLQLNHIRAFISYPYTDIAKSCFYYSQTKELSELYRKTAFSDDSLFVYFEHYFLEHSFYQYSNTDILSASVHPDISQIIEYDRTANTEYARTLRVYLAHGRNALTAAKKLHIHKSTFFYRLGKMADLFGIHTNDGLSLFAYEYSFRVLDYLEQAKALSGKSEL